MAYLEIFQGHLTIFSSNFSEENQAHPCYAAAHRSSDVEAITVCVTALLVQRCQRNAFLGRRMKRKVRYTSDKVL